MLFLYRGGGSSEIEILGEIDPKEWERLRTTAIGILKSKWLDTAAATLEGTPFTLLRGTNNWDDAFLLLAIKVPVEKYFALEESLKSDPSIRRTYSEIVRALNDLVNRPDYIRFVVAKVDEGPAPVQPPSLTLSSKEVERSLRDAEVLLASVGAYFGPNRTPNPEQTVHSFRTKPYSVSLETGHQLRAEVAQDS
jgi:hypothetical protein